MGVEIEITDENGNPVEPSKKEWQEIFDRMVEAGVIAPTKAAPPCMTCGELLEKVNVSIVGTEGFDGIVWREEETFEWIPGLHMFNVAPSFFAFVEEGWGRFNATCAGCGGHLPGLVIVEEPHGLRFDDVTRMAGVLG